MSLKVVVLFLGLLAVVPYISTSDGEEMTYEIYRVNKQDLPQGDLESIAKFVHVDPEDPEYYYLYDDGVQKLSGLEEYLNAKGIEFFQSEVSAAILHDFAMYIHSTE